MVVNEVQDKVVELTSLFGMSIYVHLYINKE